MYSCIFKDVTKRKKTIAILYIFIVSFFTEELTQDKGSTEPEMDEEEYVEKDDSRPFFQRQKCKLFCFHSDFLNFLHPSSVPLCFCTIGNSVKRWESISLTMFLVHCRENVHNLKHKMTTAIPISLGRFWKKGNGQKSSSSM